MNTFINWLNSLVANPLLNGISLILTIFGIIISVIFYYKTKKDTIPSYAIRSLEIVELAAYQSQQLQIYYSGKQVKRLTITRLAFWNGGKATLESHNIAQKDPIKLVLKAGDNILDAKIIYEKNPSNQFNYSINNNLDELLISFEYLDKYEGGIIQIIHTNQHNDSFELQGTVKGFGKPRKFVSEMPYSQYSEIYVYLLGLICTIAGVLLGYLVGIKSSNGILAFTVIEFMLIIIIVLITQIFFNKIPKEFNLFKEEFWQF